MPEYIFPTPYGFNPKDYIQSQKGATATALTTSYQTVLDITGTGFINRALISGVSGVNGSIKITIDGVLFGEFTSNQNTEAGISTDYQYVSGGTSTSFSFDFSQGQSINGKNAVPLAYPVFFKNSLKVEVKASITPYTCSYVVNWGVKA